MMAVPLSSNCRTEAFATREEAAERARVIRRRTHFALTNAFCKQRDAYHLDLVAKEVTLEERQFLRNVALGLRSTEIANDMGLTIDRVFKLSKYL